jgi:hypothetical protein
MSLQFGHGAMGNGEMMEKLLSVLASLTLRDIGGDRNSGPLGLTRQPILFAGWKGTRDLIAFHHDIHALLPNLQVPVAVPTHGFSPSSVNCQLTTVNYFSLILS